MDEVTGERIQKKEKRRKDGNRVEWGKGRRGKAGSGKREKRKRK